MNLNKLQPAIGAHPVAKRVGRGIGSGLGKTCGKGHKGQKARSGVSIKAGFEGGQMPLYRRLPKFGFNSRKTTQIGIALNKLIKLNADVVDYDILLAARLLRPKDGLRVKIILSAGDFDKKITLKGIAASAGARKAIEAAGGKVEI